MPIDELLSLINGNLDTLTSTEKFLTSQIHLTSNNGHKVPLELQKKRIESQIQNFLEMKKMLESYKNALSV